MKKSILTTLSVLTSAFLIVSPLIHAETSIQQREQAATNDNTIVNSLSDPSNNNLNSSSDANDDQSSNDNDADNGDSGSNSDDGND